MFQFPAWLQLSTENYNAISVLIGILQITAIGFAAANISQQRKQIINLSRQVVLQTEQLVIQRETVFISSYSHFNNAYMKVMAEIPPEPADDHKISSWWHRYWDIIIGEVNFCMKGQLDKVIFELWMHELAQSLFLPPHGIGYMGTYADNSEEHFNLILAECSPIRIFFRDLRKCANETDGAARAVEIGALVERTYDCLRAASRRPAGSPAK